MIADEGRATCLCLPRSLRPCHAHGVAECAEIGIIAALRCAGLKMLNDGAVVTSVHAVQTYGMQIDFKEE